ncbi:crotonase/enoyl-CoA hydratase family protein [Jiella sonneratiae]|uniref:Crotonase/enoyl-CoA hydratase family protein n=1 Tax=Jiella sonneratiae TaxID=2816856 RepID=A0ABS3JBM0_9HYPH|nr:crotonase/enoyl-CoA hydratase family protein [Jiella sonneratiae]MBO0906368.1 crotonase/enoyl-CoA hydratase family protein [Jiella sonneratiae]
MAGYETIRAETDGRGVCALTLDRPAKKNALSAAMMDELTDFAESAEADPAIRVVVLSGASGCFCAGGDLAWMMTQIEADRAGRMAEARRLAAMLRALNEMAVPLVARIEGVALGGGIGLASVADVAVADEETRFGFTETRLGLIPATIAPYVLARMGEGWARQVFMNARPFDGRHAARLGIVARAVPAAELDAAVEAEVAPYLALPRGAVGRAKRLARALGPVIDDAVIDATIARLADAWEAEEAREGIAAFLEKRQPRWSR